MTPAEFRCPITGEVARQSFLVGPSDITRSVFVAGYTTGSCGHRHRLDSPAGQPGWTVDGIEPGEPPIAPHDEAMAMAARIIEDDAPLLARLHDDPRVTEAMTEHAQAVREGRIAPIREVLATRITTERTGVTAAIRRAVCYVRARHEWGTGPRTACHTCGTPWGAR